jgi:hypothetical protein
MQKAGASLPGLLHITLIEAAAKPGSGRQPLQKNRIS